MSDHTPLDHPTYDRPCPDCGAAPRSRCIDLRETRARPRAPRPIANPHPLRRYRP